uniref:M polyprotein n=1 Tax=Sulina virus TaxID=2811963 RepID=A0A893CHU1_9VIRU|nr:GP [Sulina virus]QRR19156.1 GP [Sulina virus]
MASVKAILIAATFALIWASDVNNGTVPKASPTNMSVPENTTAVKPTTQALVSQNTTSQKGQRNRTRGQGSSSGVKTQNNGPDIDTIRWIANLYSKHYESFKRKLTQGVLSGTADLARWADGVFGYSGNLSRSDKVSSLLLKAVDPRIADVVEIQRTVGRVSDSVASYAYLPTFKYLGKKIYDVDEEGVLHLANHSSIKDLVAVVLYPREEGPYVPLEFISEGCDDPHDCCEGDPKDVDPYNIRSENIKVVTPIKSKYLGLAYLTGFLGIDVRGCKLTAEMHGRMYQMNPTSVEQLDTVTDDKIYPIIHLFIDKTDPGESCEIALCNLQPTGPEDGKIPLRKTKKQLIRIRIGETKVKRVKRNVHQAQPLAARPHKNLCNQPSHILGIQQYRLHTESHSNPNPKTSICNGTLVSGKDLTGVPGCYVVSVAKVYHSCKTGTNDSQLQKGKCMVDTKLVSCEQSSRCFKVRVNETAFVKIKANGYHSVIKCEEQCLVPSPENSQVIVTCPDGEDLVLHSNRVDIDCPLADYVGKPAHYVCRATYRPKLLYFLLIWIAFGYTIGRACFAATLGLIWLSNRILRAVCYKLDSRKDYCCGCGEYVDHTIRWARHYACNSGTCPYCSKMSSISRLKEHVSSCTSRDRERAEDDKIIDIALVPCCMRKSERFINSMSKTLSRAQWFIVLAVVSFILFHPVSALTVNNKGRDLWEKSMLELETCQSYCIFLEEGCTCPAVNLDKGRQNSHRISKRSTSQQVSPSAPRDLDVEAEWGTVHIESSYRPAVGGNHISLSWESQSQSGTKVTVSGKSEAILQLSPRTGLMWSITSPDSLESRNLFVSVLDFTQEYETQFQYLTSNRKIGTWMHGVCTGNCPNKCGCTTSSCNHQKWDNSRNWRCNPTWCLNIGGCTCCGADIERPFQDWIVTKWNSEYVRTSVIACVEFEHGSRQCETVDAGTTITLDGISVSFSGVSGTSSILPKELALVHKKPGENEDFDLTKVEGIIDGSDLCKLQSCTHGPAGDFQVYSLDSLVDSDFTTLKFWKAKNSELKKEWMSWQGTVLQYYCNPGKWPTCTMSGSVEDNTGAFENIWNRSPKLHKTHYFQSEKLKIEKGIPTLTLRGRPLQGGGQITAFLDVAGLELQSKTVKPSGVQLHISMCEGCYGCATGITCSISIRLESPETFGLHVTSLIPGVIPSETTLTCSSGQVNDFRIRLFSSDSEPKICLRVREAPDSNLDAESCLEVKLQPPDEVVLEHRSVLTSTSNATCPDGYLSCLGQNISNFFLGLGSLLASFFGTWWKGLLVVLPVLLMLLLLIFCGPNILMLFRICFTGRKTPQDRRIYYESGRKEFEKYKSFMKEEEMLMRKGKGKDN